MSAQPEANQLDIVLEEWESTTFESHPQLLGVNFEDDPISRYTSVQLTQTGQLEILELSKGLQIRSTSFVGTIRLGQLQIKILPKLRGSPLLGLLRYAYGLRDIQLFAKQDFDIQAFTFQDILIYQLTLEVEELIMRGLLRHYRRIEENLESPSGSFNFQKLAAQGGINGPVLPCSHHRRLENFLHNQVILSGLLLASRLTRDLFLRTRTRRLAALFEENVQIIRLDFSTLLRVERESNRLTEAYYPAIKIIEMLYQEEGIESNGEEVQVHLKGFLFDMNRFFQALISRFLQENLPGYVIKDEYRLKGLLTYMPGFTLPQKREPIPRPDFAVIEHGQVISLLDAKYRDLWRTGLPREMLYQLVIYSLSQRVNKVATIIYPTTDNSAKEARINLNDPISGNTNGVVIMRAVNLIELEEKIRNREKKKLQSIAHKLVFGFSSHTTLALDN